MKKPLLTIGLIFKNEIRCLERCLKSLEPLRKMIPCEVVMADTGSTDGSREVAEKYADIVFDFPWVDDFAAARNAVMARSSGEWYLSLDADEWLYSGLENLAEALRHPAENHHLMCVRFRNFESPGNTYDNYTEFYGIRIAHSGMNIHYEGRVHEALTYPKSNEKTCIMRLETLIFHDGYAYASQEAALSKWERNMELLRKTLEENPDDLHVLTQCMDSTRNVSDESAEYARRAIELLHRKWEQWSFYGAKAYRDAIIVAHMRKMPELLEWAEKTAELYPDSIFTRVDVAYAAFARCLENEDTEGLFYWADMYREGLADYKAGKYDRVELIRGVLSFFAPCWERQLYVFLAKEYSRVKRYEDAFSSLERVNGAGLEVKEQVEICTNCLLTLQSVLDQDIGERVICFWDQINQPGPAEDSVEMRRAAFINVAAYSLLPDYQEKELERPDFKRLGYTALLPLEGKCILGDAAVILETTDLDELAERLAAHDLTKLPIAALSHALLCGMPFPLPGQKLNLEEMDALANRMVPFDKFLELSQALPMEEENIQRLCWKRTLLLAGVRNCKWDNGERGMALAKAFVEMERRFLPACYAQSALTEDGSILLPPLHRFGWYCVRAFADLESGDITGYVRLLRQGLEICPEMKPMVEFLAENTPQLEVNPPDASNELLVLAQQVRMMLAQYAPGSPAVEEIKRSEAYQKVAYLLEDVKVIGLGGLPQ